MLIENWNMMFYLWRYTWAEEWAWIQKPNAGRKCDYRAIWIYRWSVRVKRNKKKKQLRISLNFDVRFSANKQRMNGKKTISMFMWEHICCNYWVQWNYVWFMIFFHLLFFISWHWHSHHSLKTRVKCSFFSAKWNNLPIWTNHSNTVFHDLMYPTNMAKH